MMSRQGRTRIVRIALCAALAASCALPATAGAATGDITTFAGTGTSGYSGDGGAATAARLNSPFGVTMGPSGEFYVADYGAHVVRKITAGGTISTFAGTGTSGYSGNGGQATSAQLSQPTDVAVDAVGNVYIADYGNHRVRKVATNGVITNMAGTGGTGVTGDGGQAVFAQVGYPIGLDFDPSGNLYIASFTNTIRKVTTGGQISTVAGTGTATSTGDGGVATAATVNQPADVAFDESGNWYIAEYGGNRVRKVTAGGIISRIAGNGTAGSTGDGGVATSATLNLPTGVDIDSMGNLFIAEFGGDVVRKVAGGNISRVAGTGTAGSLGDGGAATSAQLNGPSRTVLSPEGHFYIADFTNHKVRRIESLGKPAAPVVSAASPASPSSSNTVTVTGTAVTGTTVTLYSDAACTNAVAGGTGTAAQFASPGIAVSVADNSTTTFYATATNVAAVSGCSTTSATYVEDSAAPAAPTFSLEPGATGYGRSPSWSFSGEAGASFQCRLETGGVAVTGYDWASCSGSKTYSLTGKPDATYRFLVKATDPAGNTSAAAQSEYTLDTTPPATPSIDTAPATPAGDRSIAWDFSGDGGATFQCRLETGGVALTGYDWGTCSGSAAYSLAGKADGTYRFLVKATDAAGNTGSTAQSDYVLDTTAPAVPAIDTAPNTPDTVRSVTWDFSGEGGATLECRLESGGVALAGYDWASCSGSKTYSLAGKVDGTYRFLVKATDAAGNTGTAAQSDYVLDTAAPAAPSFTVQPGTGSTRSPSWSFTAEGGATLQCRLESGGAALTGYDWGACTSPRNYSLTGKPDGTYRLLVKATDAAGNTGSAGQSDYVLDTAAPAAPAIDTAPNTPDSDRSISWAFSGEGGASFQCRLESGGVALSGYDWASCSGSRAYSLAGKADGTYRFLVKATDAAGNTGSATEADYVLDTVAPDSPTFTVQPASPSANRSPSWSFTPAAGTATLRCRLEIGGVAVSGADWGTCSGTFTHDLSSAPDGTYTLLIEPTDAAGNVGTAASSVYVLDATAPPQPTIDSSPGPVGLDRTIQWDFSGSGARFECRLAGPNGVVANWTACSGSAAYDLDGLDDGAYVFSVKAFSGTNSEGAAATDTYTLDTTAPGQPAIDSAPVTPSQSRSLTWTYSAEASATMRCRLDSGADVVSDWTDCTTGSASYSLSGKPDGTYVFHVEATDPAGNKGAERTSSFVLDTAAPSAPAIGTTPASPATGRTPSWSFTAEASAVVTCRLQRDGADVFGWGPCASPASFDLSGKPDGDYTFSVRATDAAANTGAAASSAYTLDTTAPASTRLDAAPPLVGHDRVLQWAFAGDGMASFDCTLDRGDQNVFRVSPCASPRTFDLAGLADGTYRFSVIGRDAAGNPGPATTYDYELDTVAPHTPEIGDKPAAVGRSLKPAMTFTGDPGSTFQCRLERAGAVVSNWTACASPKSFVLASDEEGKYKMLVRSLDGAGNVGDPVAASYELDRTDPDAPDFSSTPGASGDDPTPKWSFKAERGASVECRLVLVGADDPIADWEPCESPQSYNLSRRDDGTYRLMVRATDAAGNTGITARDDYQLKRASADDPKRDTSGGDAGAGAGAGAGPQSPASTPAAKAFEPDPAPGAKAGDTPAAKDKASEPDAASPESAARGRATGVPRGQAGGQAAAGGGAPKAEKKKHGLAKVGDLPVIRNLGEAAKVLAENADKSVFPSSLLLIVGLFLLVQKRIDRGDPKLALAPAFADPDLEFRPPPTFR